MLDKLSFFAIYFKNLNFSLIKPDLVMEELPYVQAALVICGLFICEFAYMRFRKVDKTSLYAIFCHYSLAYMRFFLKKYHFSYQI